jgi:hypothetical protein
MRESRHLLPASVSDWGWRKSDYARSLRECRIERQIDAQSRPERKNSVRTLGEGVANRYQSVRVPRR